jgi:hypothetical protein
MLGGGGERSGVGWGGAAQATIIFKFAAALLGNESTTNFVVSTSAPHGARDANVYTANSLRRRLRVRAFKLHGHFKMDSPGGNDGHTYEQHSGLEGQHRHRMGYPRPRHFPGPGPCSKHKHAAMTATT